MINIKIGIGYNRTRIKCYKKTKQKQKQNANNNSFYQSKEMFMNLFNKKDFLNLKFSDFYRIFQ